LPLLIKGLLGGDGANVVVDMEYHASPGGDGAN